MIPTSTQFANNTLNKSLFTMLRPANREADDTARGGQTSPERNSMATSMETRSSTQRELFFSPAISHSPS